MSELEVIRYVTEQRILDNIDMRIFLLGGSNPQSLELRKLATSIRQKLASDIEKMTEADFDMVDEIRRELFS